MKKPRYNAVKIESLDRGAVSISTLRKASAAVEWERGHRRSVRTMPVVRMLGRQRRSAGLSQEFFVKRYHWLFGDVLFSRDRFSVYSMNRLAKRFIFLHFPAGGEQKRRTRRRQL